MSFCVLCADMRVGIAKPGIQEHIRVNAEYFIYVCICIYLRFKYIKLKMCLWLSDNLLPDQKSILYKMKYIH